MTTHTLTGIAIYTDPFSNSDDAVGLDTSNVTLELVVPESTTSLSYVVNPALPGDEPGDETVDISLNDYTVRINGTTVTDGGALDPEISIFEVVWTDAGGSHTSTVLVPFVDEITVTGLGIVDADYIFVIDGAALPAINTPAEWDAFNLSVTSIGVPVTGPYAPGVDIPLTSLGGTVSEDDIITGTDGKDVLRGGIGDDEIEGLDGNDKLFGGDGSDKLFGGNGNDTLNPGDNTSFDSINTGAGKDKVVLSDIVTGYVQLDHWDLDARIVVNLDGNANTGTIKKTGNGLTTIIDVKNPMQADPMGVYGLGVAGTAFNDVFNVTVVDGGWMQVKGGAGKDKYDITASTGSVRLDFSDATGNVTANLATGKIKKDGFGNTEFITGTGQVWEVRAGMQNDKITGSANNESFILMAGTDTLDGGDGYDRLRYDRTGVDGVTVNLDSGTATGLWKGEAFTHTISGIEHLRGSNGDDVLKGSDAQGDRLEGRDGDDTLRGGDGDDTLEGDDGNDILRGGDGDDTLYGDAGNDKLFGGDGTDRLRGGDGDDILNPGDNTWFDAINAGRGNDTVVLSDVVTGSISIDHWDLSAGITVNLDGNANTGTIDKSGDGTTTIVDVKNPMLANGLSVGGTSADDTFDVTVADDGWMSVNGRGGKDTFIIGASTGKVRLDFRDYDGITTGATVNLATGNIADDGFGNTESITGTGQVWEVRGTMQNDTVTGSGNDESFILMAGTDTLDGGGGYDRLRYDRTGVDGVTVNLDTGIATGTWSGEAFTHTISGIEQVLGSNGDDVLVGADAIDTRLEGRDGDDLLEGAFGDDTLQGGNGKDRLWGDKGDDLLQGDAGNDKLWGEWGKDRLEGGDGNDRLDGGKGNDRLLGGKGKDRMDGGDGNDRMTGGAGNDTFIFSNGDDVITDFNAASNKEKIDLSGVSSITGFNDLKNNHVTQVGSDLVIDDLAGNTLTLNGLSIGDLDKGDFIF